MVDQFGIRHLNQVLQKRFRTYVKHAQCLENNVCNQTQHYAHWQQLFKKQSCTHLFEILPLTPTAEFCVSPKDNTKQQHCFCYPQAWDPLWQSTFFTSDTHTTLTLAHGIRPEEGYCKLHWERHFCVMLSWVKNNLEYSTACLTGSEFLYLSGVVQADFSRVRKHWAV